MNAIVQPLGATNGTQTLYSTPTPSPPPLSPYNFYAGLPNTSYVWYPPVMDHVQSPYLQARSLGKDMDSFSGPEDPPSSSASPNSHMLGLDGLASAAASPSATTEARMNTPSVPAACLACVSFPLSLILSFSHSFILSFPSSRPGFLAPIALLNHGLGLRMSKYTKFTKKLTQFSTPAWQAP